jgi:hypothetical protein
VGIVAVLRKPIFLEQLADAVEACLARTAAG